MIKTSTSPIQEGRDLFAFITSGSRGWASRYACEGAKFIRVQNLRRGRIDLELLDIQHVQPPIGAEGTRTRLRAGDIVISITADLGRVGLISEELGDAYVSQHVALARPKDTTLAPYIAWYISGPEGQKQLGLLDRGVTRSGLGLKDIAALRVPMPTPDDRDAIVRTIERQSARIQDIAEDFRLGAKLGERLLMTTLQRLLSGGPEYAEGTGRPSPTVNEDMAGTWPFTCIPETWQWMPFLDLFVDVTDSRKKIPSRAYLSIGDYPIIDQGEREIGGWSDDSSAVNQGPLPAVIFGDHTRCVKYVTRPFIQGADGVKVLSPITAKVVPRFAYWLLRAVELPDKGYSRHFRYLRNSWFPVPPLTQQQKVLDSIELSNMSSQQVISQIDGAERLLPKLSQAVLGKAFSFR